MQSNNKKNLPLNGYKSSRKHFAVTCGFCIYTQLRNKLRNIKLKKINL